MALFDKVIPLGLEKVPNAKGIPSGKSERPNQGQRKDPSAHPEYRDSISSALF